MERRKDTVKRVMDYVEMNLENEIDLDCIARDAGYSKFHLNRIFSEETGCTIHKYLQTRRLALAAEKLAGTDQPIAQIAHEAGYSSQQAFSLAFKQAYSCSPGIYRNAGKIRGMAA